MDSFYGSPWDFGTGFTQPITQMPGTGLMPVAPQVDLANTLASGLASKGIRPQQFFANPSVAQDVMQPPNPGTSPWDATPVSMPGGPPVSLGGVGPQGGNPNVQTDDSEPQAAGGSGDVQGAKTKTFGEKLQETLKGVKMPTPPTPQKVSTPAAPHPDPRGQKAGELLSLLLAAQGGGAGGVHLPPGLGASLQGIFR